MYLPKYSITCSGFPKGGLAYTTHSFLNNLSYKDCGNWGSAFRNFFNRIAYRKRRAVAVSTTARKLATILWNMLYKNQHYNPPTVYGYLDQKRKRKVIELQKQIANIDARLSDIKLA
jgi:hypothetical protein